MAFAAFIDGVAVSGTVSSEMIFPVFTGELTIKASAQLAIVSVYSFAVLQQGRVDREVVS